ncbi:putative serine/threonine-protein kinase iks1 [Linnemannia schmuckeri]|uniref:non-specific serine/threonine protein kinase n=1 Tax=Linnemannia schmuckeri TaxID=64567 RepID=A0A9P5VC61_9FUNG|nr:putative serine/threonine-protein kinase iks1 [Linnemannia schmuckeri]
MDNNPHDDDTQDTERKRDSNQHLTYSDPRHHQQQLHPLQAEHQQQPWLIPHPNLPIAWYNNDRSSQVHANREHDPRYSSTAFPVQHPPQSRYLLSFKDLQEPGQKRPDSADTRPASYSAGDNSDWQLQHYRESVSDQGHESDPSELMRSPVLFSSSPPSHHQGFHAAMTRGEGSDRSGREILSPVRRTNRSMSLSMSPNIWHDGRFVPNDHQHSASSSSGMPFSARSHREIVPYSQEWRVILRSPPRGRTVLYNPQMQSLVVQTTVGPDSHPMSLRHDSRMCALCRRPLDLDNPITDQTGTNNTSGFMDSNYFRMLADANIALSRRGSLQGNTESEYPRSSPIGSPTSSSRASLDIDSQTPPLDESRNRARDVNNPAHLSHDALNQGYYERFFVEQMKLGRGYRGSVFLCQHILDGIHLGEYAIKKVAVGDNHDWLVQMLREVHLLERLHHPNIVSYKHAWLENHQLHKFGPEVTCLFILMECANGGNLEEYIERPAEIQPRQDVGTPAAEGSGQGAEAKKPMSARERLQSKRQQLQGVLKSPPAKGGEASGTTDGSTAQQRHFLSITEIWSFFFDICEGLAHLHRLGIIHRDLKPPNLLLSYSSSQIKGAKGERPRILITDFGECEISDQAAKRDRTGATGTLEFLAPELLSVDANGRYTDEFSFKGDMWSLGMVLYYLCYSRLPYTQIDDVDILKEEIREFKSITLPADESGDRVIPEELKILIRVLLSTDKSKRPSCDDILSMLSPQRDRMMHGNMDSPTTASFRATSSNLSSQSSASQEDGEGGRKEGSDENDTRSDSLEQHRPSSRGPQTLASHRQHYYSPTVGTGRRRSRTTLVSDNSRTVPGQPLHSPATVARNTASPSSNLHKKVKPLGLGLRHMLRRRMMHPAAISGTGMYKYPRNEQGFPAQGSLDMTLKARAPKPLYLSSSPVVIDRSPALDLTRVPQASVIGGQRQTDLFQQQQFQSRKEAVSGKGSNLGLAVELNPQGHDSIESSGPSGSAGRGGGNSTEVSRGPRRSLRQTEARRKSYEAVAGSSRSTNHSSSNSKQKRPRDPPRRKNLNLDSEESSWDDDLVSTHRRSFSEHQQQRKDEEVGSAKAITKAHAPLGKSYWTNLASTHARDMSRSESGTGVDGDVPVASVAPVDDDDEVLVNGGMSSSGTESDVDENEDEEEDGLVGALEHQSLRQRRQQRRQSRRRRVSQQSITLKQAIQLQHPHSSPHSPTLVSSSSSPTATLPEHFSAHFMFVSLVVRIWACLSICNPIMVRPLVLYPVLIMTVVWDRYVLSLISERFLRRKKSSSVSTVGARQRRRRVGQNGVDEEDVGFMDPDRFDDQQAVNTDVIAGDASAAAPAAVAVPTDRDADFNAEGRQEGSVVLKTRDGNNNDDNEDADVEADTEDDKSITLIWQALLSGVIIQVAWVGLVWLFSRGRICAVL